MAKYEYELGAFDGLGLSDLEMDDALTYCSASCRPTPRARTMLGPQSATPP
jgi:hypothetical protein